MPNQSWNKEVWLSIAIAAQKVAAEMALNSLIEGKENREREWQVRLGM